MKHFLHKIDASGLFIEDCFWEDHATPEVPGREAVPEVLDEQGAVITQAVPAAEAIPAYAGDPIPADMIATPVPGGFYWPKWNGTAWVEGGTAPAPTVPQQVTMCQARLALLGAGVYASVQPAIDAMPEPQKTAAQIQWDFRPTVERTNGLMTQLGSVMGLTDAQIDALFVAASKL